MFKIVDRYMDCNYWIDNGVLRSTQEMNKIAHEGLQGFSLDDWMDEGTKQGIRLDDYMWIYRKFAKTKWMRRKNDCENKSRFRLEQVSLYFAEKSDNSGLVPRGEEHDSPLSHGIFAYHRADKNHKPLYYKDGTAKAHCVTWVIPEEGKLYLLEPQTNDFLEDNIYKVIKMGVGSS